MGTDKLFADVDGVPLVVLTLRAAALAGIFDRVVLAAPGWRHQQLRQLATEAGFGDVVLTEGGERRQQSVRNALAEAGPVDIVAIHDAARPLCPPALFGECVAAAETHGAATAAIPVVDSIMRGDGGVVVECLQRGDLFAVQTPQAFRRDLLAAGHEHAAAAGLEVDDDAAVVEALGAPVHIVAGSIDNFKVTHPRDLLVLRAVLEARG